MTCTIYKVRQGNLMSELLPQNLAKVAVSWHPCDPLCNVHPGRHGKHCLADM